MLELNKIIRPHILKLKAYSSARDEFAEREGLFLDANENPFGDLNRYPDPNQTELKKAVAREKGVKASQIFVGNGSDEAIDLLFRIFCTPGKDKALTFSPTYGMYEVSAALHAVELIQLPLDADFQLDVEAAKAFLMREDIALTFLCSPNNPTGNAFPRAQVESILQSARGIVVVDEAYIDFSAEPSCLDLLENYPNLVVLQTMSKAWGLAAARIGFAFAQEALIQVLHKVKPPYNVSELNQQAALNALGNASGVKSEVQILLSARENLRAELSKLRTVVRVFPSDANFLLVECVDANELYQSLIAQKIIVRNRHTLVRNCLRVTVGTPEENEVFIRALKSFENEKSTLY